MVATLDRAVFFDSVRKAPFPGKLTGGQVSGMEALLDACPVDLGTQELAYCLATTFHETARTMLPIAEYGKGAGKEYGKPTGPYNQVYYGRGNVQLTWLANYQQATTELHTLGLLDKTIDLAKNPDAAMDPDVAASILYIGMLEGWFTGKKLSNYFSPTKSDPINARRIINGTDKAQVIAGYFQHFLSALKAAGHAPGATVAAVPVPPVVVAPLPPVAVPVPPVVVAPLPPVAPPAAPVVSTVPAPSVIHKFLTALGFVKK